MGIMKWLNWLGCFALVLFCGTPGDAQESPTNEVKVLQLDPGSTIRVSGPWAESPVKYSNATEFVVMERTRVRTEGMAQEQAVEFPLARMLVTVEPRSSHEDALKRLEDIAASRPETARFVEIAGWPAVELEFDEALPRRGKQAIAAESAELRKRAIIAIAAGDELLNFDISLAPNAPLDLLRGAQDLVRSVRVTEQADPEIVRQTIERMQEAETRRKGQRTERRQGNVPDGGANQGGIIGSESAGTVAVQTGVGELEVAASADANAIVIAGNGGLSFSTNRGATFGPGATGVFGLNDPSIGRAVSGNFYLDVIAFPTGTAAQLNVTGCTNAVSQSVNNGATFALQGYSAQCPLTGTGICFPDQEHLATDSVNATGAGNDQLYAVWRNFTTTAPVANCRAINSGNVTASISCSQDNGVNWTARAAIPGGGDFPRVAIGRDGTVYVISLNGNSVLLNRFTSCANGLTAATGFPVTVATMSGAVTCPVSGLDRCNNGNTLSSPMVAPDPDNANRIFVSFAENDGGTGERIVTLESTNGGVNFGNRTIVSGNVSARRFMPWSCSTAGSAWVGWYDRTAATAVGAGNDLTEYFVGSTEGPARNLSNNPDPQCASGWPCAPRSTNDSDSCTVQPQLAGTCQRPGGGGSGNRCDFDAGICPPGENCQTGGGCPKYGDYNGIACAGNYVIAAWASATAPRGLPAAAALGVYSSTIFVGADDLWQILLYDDDDEIIPLGQRR
jgi:hypothetical protein